MIFIAWTKRYGRTDVGAVRSSALLEQLKMREIYPLVIELWKPNSIMLQVRWIISTFLTLVTRKKQLVYVSCSPYKHLLIVLLGVILGRHKLVVDFRDAYSIDIRDKNYSGIYMLAKLTEKIIYRFCVKFIVVTPGLKKRYKEIFGNDKKIMVIPNGHEISKETLDKLQHLQHRERRENFIKVVYPGMYSPYFKPEQARKYIYKLKEKIEGAGVDYEIVFVGTDKETKKLLRNEKNVKFIPDTNDSTRLSYEDTIKILNDADLTFMPINSDYGCATKIYDYLALGLPIFNFIDKNNWLHEYISERIINSCENIRRFEMDYEGKYNRTNQMKKLSIYIADLAKEIGDPSYKKMDILHGKNN